MIPTLTPPGYKWEYDEERDMWQLWQRRYGHRPLIMISSAMLRDAWDPDIIMRSRLRAICIPWWELVT